MASVWVRAGFADGVPTPISSVGHQRMDVRQRFPAGHAEYSKGHRKDDLEKREVPPLRERVVAEGVDGA